MFTIVNAHAYAIIELGRDIFGYMYTYIYFAAALGHSTMELGFYEEFDDTMETEW